MSAGLRERLLALAAKARRVSNDQCSGKNWAMSIPPQPDDSDMVIHALADAAETAAAVLDGQGDAAALPDLSNHHNALDCPYCNPLQLAFCGNPADHERPLISTTVSTLPAGDAAPRVAASKEKDDARLPR